jgi:hypothetical protein
VRVLFLLLLLVNLLFLAWTQWVAPPAVVTGRATQSSTNPGAIRLLREAPLAQELKTAVAGPAAEAPSGSEPVEEAAPYDGASCVSGGPYGDRGDAEAAATRLEQQGFISRLRSAREMVQVGQWVQIRNLATPEDAENALAAIRAAGIPDAYLLSDEPSGNVISLGVFSSPQRAAQVAAVARQAGFTPSIQPRMRAEDAFWVDVDRRANAGLPGLEAFQGEAGAGSGVELRPCPASAESVTPVTSQP